MNEADRVKSAQTVRNIEEQWPHHLAIINLACRSVRAKYEALLKQGFNEQQALYLCFQKLEP